MRKLHEHADNEDGVDQWLIRESDGRKTKHQRRITGCSRDRQQNMLGSGEPETFCEKLTHQPSQDKKHKDREQDWKQDRRVFDKLSRVAGKNTKDQ